MIKASHFIFVTVLLGSSIVGCATTPESRKVPLSFGTFLDRVDAAQHELQQGHPESYKALWSHHSDVSLAGGFGGGFERGWDGVAKRLDWASSQFRSGHSEVERLSFSASGGIGYLVQAEHLFFTTPGTGAQVERRYRVTMLFRLESGQWRIIHRHADAQVTREAPR